MDPDEAWKRLLDAYHDQQWSEVTDVAESLIWWLDRGGFAPAISKINRLPHEWHAELVRRACQLALTRANKSVEPD